MADNAGRSEFDSTIAFVLAYEEDTAPLTVSDDEVASGSPEATDDSDSERPLQPYKGKPAFIHALNSVCMSGVDRIVVLVSDATAQEVKAIVEDRKACADRVGCVIDVELYDGFAGEDGASCESSSNALPSGLYGLGTPLLRTMLRDAHTLDPSFGNILVISYEQVGITPGHIEDLLADFNENPDADVEILWTKSRPTLPIVISRRFLDWSLACTDDSPDLPYSPLPRVRSREFMVDGGLPSVDPVTPPGIKKMIEMIDVGEHIFTETHGYLPTTAMWKDMYAEGDGHRSDLVWAEAFGRRCRMDFPLLNRPENEDLVYLDNAATAQSCYQSLEAEEEYYRDYKANVYRGVYRLSEESTRIYDDSRKYIAEFIGAEPENVAFTLNTSGACNLVAQTWASHMLKPGDVVALSITSHHSGFVPFMMAADRIGARVVPIPYDESGRIDRHAYSSIMDQHPSLVCFPHVSNVLGIEEPAHELAAEAHRAGARVLVDCAQSAPHMRLDVSRLGADWIAFSGHKAYGPMGIGCLWYSDDAAEEMIPAAGGGGTVSYVGPRSYRMNDRPMCFEPGTPLVSQAYGLARSLEYLDTLGMEDVRRHERILTGHALDQLSGIPDMHILGDHSGEDGRIGLLSLALDGANPMELVGFLSHLSIAVRGGSHCALPLHGCLGSSGTVRLSMGVYTTLEDIDKAAHSIRTYMDVISR